MRFGRWVLAAAMTVWLLLGAVSPGAVEPLPRPHPSQPLAAVPLDVSALQIAERIASLSLDEKLAQLMLVHCAGQDPAAVSACLAAAGASGLILMGDNIGADPGAVAALTAALEQDPLFASIVAIDEEGGVVTRLPWDTLPGADVLALAPAADTEAAFAARSELLRTVGVNVNFGVVADVTDDAASFLFDRVLGHDPQSGAERVAAAVRGEGVASTLKHFPGHGAANGNSHSQLPIAGMDQVSWAQGAAIPFAAGIAAGAQLVMMAHIVAPAVDAAPASLSPAWHRLLREQLGFTGVVVSDDLLMLQHNGLPEFADPAANALRALQAGTDLLLWVLPADPASAGVNLADIRRSLATAVADGRLPEAHVDDALARVLALRHTLAH